MKLDSEDRVNESEFKTARGTATTFTQKTKQKYIQQQNGFEFDQEFRTKNHN